MKKFDIEADNIITGTKENSNSEKIFSGRCKGEN